MIYMDLILVALFKQYLRVFKHCTQILIQTYFVANFINNPTERYFDFYLKVNLKYKYIFRLEK